MNKNNVKNIIEDFIINNDSAKRIVVQSSYISITFNINNLSYISTNIRLYIECSDKTQFIHIDYNNINAVWIFENVLYIRFGGVSTITE